MSRTATRIVFLLFNFVGALPAAEYVVGPNLEINTALYLAAPGDIVRIPYSSQPYVGNFYAINKSGIQILGESLNGQQPKIKGHLEVRESHSVLIENLEVYQDGTIQAPQAEGIVIRNSLDVEVRYCYVHDCGGGGISASHSDLLRIFGNHVGNNAKLNPDQHSGISIYQPVFPAWAAAAGIQHDGRYWDIEISRNHSFWNRNTVPDANGNLTDGNGIILDDYLYTQTNFVPEGVTLPISPYNGRTIVENNRCWKNGGRGIHCYLATNAYIRNNTCYQNQRSSSVAWRAEITATLSNNIHVLNNIMYSSNGQPAALVRSSHNIHFYTNLLYSQSPPTSGLTDFDDNSFNSSLNWMQVDPRLRNDHSLRAGSPAIDAGVTWYGHDEYRHDIYWNYRLRGGSVDIGACEY